MKIIRSGMVALCVGAFFSYGTTVIAGETEMSDAKAYKNITVSKLATELSQRRLIDIRTPAEWRQTGVVKGSVLLTAVGEDGRIVKDFAAKLAEIAGPADDVTLICRSGKRSAAVAQWLSEELGYKTVSSVEEGITGWIAEGKPVEQP